VIGYGRDVAPGLVEVLNLDLPDTVTYFLDEHRLVRGKATRDEDVPNKRFDRARDAGDSIG